MTGNTIEKEGPKIIYDKIIKWIKEECFHLFEVVRSVKGFDFLSNSIFSAFLSHSVLLLFLFILFYFILFYLFIYLFF